jgi:cysteine-rich repeat protein
VDTATCLTVNGAGDPVSLERIAQQELRFRFPDSDGQFLDPNDDLTFTGPTTIAVTAAGSALPCGLASLPCNRNPSLLACVDQIYATNGTCNAQPEPTFPHFTALPPSNDYQALCVDPMPPCTGQADEVRFTVDAAGNILIPMDWRGVRVDRDAVPVARLLRASSTIESYAGRGVPIRIPNLDNLGSYSPQGIKLPPLFDPQSDPAQTTTATFFGSTDAEETVLRIARHRAPSNQCDGGANDGLPCIADGDCAGESCAPPRCVGGTNAGSVCSTSFECPSGECGPGIFDFSTRLLEQSGPVLLRLGACIGGSNPLDSCTDDSGCPGGQCGAFTLAALDPVPLDGLNQSVALNAFVMEEAIFQPPTDLNGDGDSTDPVVKLADRGTGLIESIGESGSQARAVTRIQQPPFSFPALAAQDDLLAFLEPEPWQGASDTNANERVFDTILRVYRLGGGEATDPLSPLAADAAPVIDERSLAISDGLVFFRSSEAANATQETTRANLNSAGEQASGGAGFSSVPSLSADGRYVAFASHATNLVPNDTWPFWDIFVRDRVLGVTTRVSVSGAGAQGYGDSRFSPFISAGGRFVAFLSQANNLVPGDTALCPPIVGSSCLDVFVHDRDADEDGVFDETGLGERKTVRVSVASDGTESNGHSRNYIGSISPDGRFVTFASDADNLVPGDGNGATDAFLHDRDADGDGIFDETGPGERATVRISVDPNGLDADGVSVYTTVSADGRFVVFQSSACNLIPGDCATTGDTNGVDDIFLRDRDTDADGIFDEPGDSVTIRVSVDSAGSQGNAASFEPQISADGGTVGFTSLASNLVPGDTNAKRDVFAYDRVSGRVTVLSTTPAGKVADGNSSGPRMTPDGRYVVFGSNGAQDLAGPTGSSANVYLYDRTTRLIARIDVNAAGEAANGAFDPSAAVSADGSIVAFASFASDLVANDTNNQGDIFVRAASAASADLTGDGDASDTLLRILDTTTGPPSTLIDLCPAAATAVASGRAAFLRPEAAGQTPSLACPTAPLVGNNPDLNGDNDANDDVVHFWDGTTVDNLGKAATAVALSDTWIAALVSEAAEGDSVLNGDGDANDTVVHVHPAGAGTWTNVSQAAETLALAGSRVAFLTGEAAQGNSDLNGDGDMSDRVVQTYDAATATLTNVGQAAEEIVLGSAGLIAFRTLEARQNNQDLNDDTDSDDGVLQVYDAVGGLLLNSQQAVTPCRLEACDPRVPYRVRDDTVTFLTLEADQGEDLNDDGDLGDLVLQVLNVRQACSNGGPAGACHTLAAASAGICTDTGDACVDDGACPGGECFVPPGGCLFNLGTACNPTNGSGCIGDTQFCQPILGSPAQGTCYLILNDCRSDADCPGSSFCSQANQDFQRLMDPLNETAASAAIFTGSGRCREDLGVACTSSVQCSADEFCSGGSCQREHGVCANDDDCPTDSACEPELVRATADDADLDELPDVIDNCPQVPNILQEDLDADGIGDACDAETCGNGVAEESEDCDDGNTVGGDGCEADCTLPPTLIAGTKLLVKDSAKSDERSILFVSRDKAGIATLAGAAQDPTVGGARLELFNEATGERALIDLPAANWRGLGSPAGSKGYKYRDRSHQLGPCKLVLIKPGKVLRASCRGADIPFTLNESAQGSVQVSLRSGSGTGGIKYCSRFGGSILADYHAAEGISGRFKAKDADAPLSCPH